MALRSTVQIILPILEHGLVGLREGEILGTLIVKAPAIQQDDVTLRSVIVSQEAIHTLRNNNHHVVN